MGITIESYPITPTALGAGVDGKIKHVPVLGAYVEFAKSGSTRGLRMWNDHSLEKMPEWTTTNGDFDLSTSFEEWCISPVTGHVFVSKSASGIIKRLTRETLATAASFGNGQDKNDSNSLKFSYGVASAIGVDGTGYICSLSINSGCMIFNDSLVPIAASNTTPDFTTNSPVDFFTYIPNSVTGRPQWWLTISGSGVYNSANIVSYVPGVIDLVGGENATVTEIHRLNIADHDTFFQAAVDSNCRYIPCPEANVLLVCSEGDSGTGMYVVALNLSDTTEVLWRANYPGCTVTSGIGTSTDYGNRPITRGRYMAMGDSPNTGEYSPQQVHLIDLETGAILDSGAVTSVASITASPERSFWNASTGRLIFAIGGDVVEGIHSIAFDYDLSAGLGYGQDFDAPDLGVYGYRGTRLERSNVTGVINTLFEDLEEKLTSYVDDKGDSLIQEPLDMNNKKIVNLQPASEPDDLITKEQAEDMV